MRHPIGTHVFSGRLTSNDRANLLADPKVSTHIRERGTHWVDLSEEGRKVSGIYYSNGIYGDGIRTEEEEVYSISVTLVAPSTTQLELADKVLNEHMLFRLKN